MIIDIPYQEIPKDTLIRLLEEFVTRDGTQYGENEVSLDSMIEQVMSQLKNQKAYIVYDDESNSCQIITKEDREKMPI